MRDRLVDAARAAVFGRKGVRIGDGAHRLPACVVGNGAEGIEGGLTERPSPLLRHDGRDDVDELGKARRLYDVAVVEQRVHHTRKDEAVLEGVDVLQEVRRALPERLSAGCGDRPDIPLIKGDADALCGALFRAHIFDGRAQRADKFIHIVCAAQKVLQGTRARSAVHIVAVHGQQIDLLIGVLQDLSVPLGEGRHIVIGRAGDDEPESSIRVRLAVHLAVGPAHELCRLQRLSAVLVGAEMPRLPRAVHLVADAPIAHAVGLLRAVCAAHVGDRRPARVIAVLHEVRGVQNAARPHVYRHHRLNARNSAPLHKFVRAKLVGFR